MINPPISLVLLTGSTNAGLHRSDGMLNYDYPVVSSSSSWLAWAGCDVKVGTFLVFFHIKEPILYYPTLFWAHLEVILF